jgi:hypothetical protein
LDVFTILSIVAAVDKIAESSSEMEATGNYLGLNFVRAPKKNHDAMERIGKPFVQWFKNHGVRTEIYHHLYTAQASRRRGLLRV